MAGIVLKLNEIMDSLPASEQKIAVYLISNLNDVVGISVEELAGRSDSSQAAVVRFCKKLGYRGYREFSLKLASELAVARQSQDRECSDIKIGDRAGNVIQSVCQHNMRAIEDTSTLIDPDQVELAAGKLFDARRPLLTWPPLMHSRSLCALANRYRPTPTPIFSCPRRLCWGRRMWCWPCPGPARRERSCGPVKRPEGPGPS